MWRSSSNICLAISVTPNKSSILQVLSVTIKVGRNYVTYLSKLRALVSGTKKYTKKYIAKEKLPKMKYVP